MSRLVPAIFLILAACGQNSGSHTGGPPVTTTTPAVVVSTAGETSKINIEAAQNIDPDSPKAAVALLKHYHALIGDRRYAEAWSLWGHDGADSGMTEKDFAASFDEYSIYCAEIGEPGEVDAGMMQRWISIPVQVTGTSSDGHAFALEGTMILHRIAREMPDVGPEQKLWRIRGSDLKPRSQ